MSRWTHGTPADELLQELAAGMAPPIGRPVFFMSATLLLIISS